MLKKIKKLFKPKIVVNVTHSYEQNLSGKIAVVFGGTGGIGLSIANKLLSSGATTIVCGKSEDPHVDNLHFLYFDLLNAGEIKSVIDKIIGQFGRIDILVNSQGICPKDDYNQDFFAISPDDFDSVMAINAKSVFFSCQYICDYFIKNHIRGRALNIVSTESLKGGIVPYGLSKSAVLSLTRGLGKKMAKHGIIVNGISPGATATKMMNYTNDLRKDYIPSGRMCLPDEIAQLALFMLSDEGIQMPGQVVVIDGGESL